MPYTCKESRAGGAKPPRATAVAADLHVRTEHRQNTQFRPAKMGLESAGKRR